MLRRPHLSLAFVGAVLVTALVCAVAPPFATAAAPPDALLKKMQSCVAEIR